MVGRWTTWLGSTALVIVLVGVALGSSATAQEDGSPAIDCLTSQVVDLLMMPPDQLREPDPDCPNLTVPVVAPAYNPFRGPVDVSDATGRTQIGAVLAVLVNEGAAPMPAPTTPPPVSAGCHEPLLDLPCSGSVLVGPDGFVETSGDVVAPLGVGPDGSGPVADLLTEAALDALVGAAACDESRVGCDPEDLGDTGGTSTAAPEGELVLVIGHGNPVPRPRTCEGILVDEGVLFRDPASPVWDASTGASPDLFDDFFLGGNTAIVSNCSGGPYGPVVQRVLGPDGFVEAPIRATRLVGPHGTIHVIPLSELPPGVDGFRLFDFTTVEPFFTPETVVASAWPPDLSILTPIDDVPILSGTSEPVLPPASGLLVIEKVADSDEPFTFTGLPGGDVVVAGGSSERVELPPGDYTLTERIPPGWEEPSVTCAVGSEPDVETTGASVLVPVEAGRTSTCEFRNSPTPAPTVTETEAVPTTVPTAADPADEAPAPDDGGAIPAWLLGLVGGVALGAGGLAYARTKRREPDDEFRATRYAVTRRELGETEAEANAEPVPTAPVPITERLGEPLRTLRNRLSTLLSDDSEANQEAIVAAIRAVFASHSRADAVWLFNVATRALGGKDVFDDVLDGAEQDAFDGFWDCSTWLRLEETDTDLDGMFTGDFDAVFDEERCSFVVTVKVRFEFDEDVSAESRRAFRDRLMKAAGHWDEAAALVCRKDPSAPCCPRIPIRVRIVEVASGEHHTIDVEAERRRPNVMEDMNVDQDLDEKTLTHEFGHVLGCYDEYHADGVSGFFENYLPGFVWHLYGHEEDTSSVMNHGCEFRGRHFERFAAWVNDARECPAGCTYEIELLKRDFMTSTWSPTEVDRLVANQQGPDPAGVTALAAWLAKPTGMIRRKLAELRADGRL